MIYGKLVNGDLYGAPTPLKTADVDIFTNDPQVYLANGYKPIVFVDCPSGDGKKYNEAWVETESKITQTWVERPEADDDVISDAEALDIIMGGDDS